MNYPFLALMTMRILIGIAGAEICPRYFLWWLRTRHIQPDQPLSILMLALSLHGGGVAALLLYHAFWSVRFYEPHGNVAIPVVFDLLIGAASLLSLVPCWQISRNYTWIGVGQALAVRVMLAIACTALAIYCRGVRPAT